MNNIQKGTNMDNQYSYEKMIIGKILYFYRKNSKETLKSFLYNKGKFYNENCLMCDRCTNKEYICTPRTLNKIEKGEYFTKKDCYYYRLCEKFSLKFSINSLLLSKIEIYRNILIENLIDFSKSKLKALSANIELELNKNGDIIYYSEMLNLYLSVIKYKLYRTIATDKDIRLYNYLFDHVKEDDKKIILVFLFDMTYRVTMDCLNREEIMIKAHPYLDEPILYKIKMTHISEMNYLEAYQCFEKEENNKGKITNYQFYTLLQYKAFIFFNSGNFEKSYNILKESLLIPKIDELSDYDLLGCYKKLAIICFSLGNYEEAINYYYLNLKYENSLGNNYVLLFYSLETENRSEEIRAIIEQINIDSIRYSSEKTILEYYKMKYSCNCKSKENAKWLEEYIVKQIKPYFEEMGILHKKIFISDLKKLVNITGDYKKLDKVLDIEIGNINDECS